MTKWQPESESWNVNWDKLREILDTPDSFKWKSDTTSCHAHMQHHTNYSTIHQ